MLMSVLAGDVPLQRWMPGARRCLRTCASRPDGTGHPWL